MLPNRSGPVAGVVLAAGASRRMGANKLLLELEGETLLRRAVRRALSAGLDPVLVVVGHEAERATAELVDLRCRAVTNPDPGRGMNGSIRCGVGAVPREAVAAVVTLADMPFVTAEMIAEMVARYRSGAAPLVASEYGGVLAPPMLYDRALFGELDQLDGDGCGKRVVKRHRDEAETISWPAAALADVDEPGDFDRVRAETSGG